MQALILGFALCKLLVVFGVALLSGNLFDRKYALQLKKGSALTNYYQIRQCTQRLCKYQLATAAHELVDHVIRTVQLIYSIRTVFIGRYVHLKL